MVAKPQISLKHHQITFVQTKVISVGEYITKNIQQIHNNHITQ